MIRAPGRSIGTCFIRPTANNLYTVQNANGVSGNNVTGLRSKYIVEDQRADPVRIALNTVWSKALKNDVHVSAGASWNKQVTIIKAVADLLGCDFWVDLNQFAELDSNDPNGSQNNLDNPNNVVREVRSVRVQPKTPHPPDQCLRTGGKEIPQHRDLRGPHAVANQLLARGRLQEPGSSQRTRWARARSLPLMNAGLKAGAVYKLSGRHYISGNAAIVSRTPSPRTALPSPRTRNSTIDGRPARTCSPEISTTWPACPS